MPSVSANSLLEVRDLKTQFKTPDGLIKAVDGVNLSVRPGEILGLVGESGCGKSVTSLSIMRLVGHPGRIVSGSVKLNGLDLLQLPESEMVGVRGNRISMVFQQPQSSLDPVYKVGAQVAEAILIHRSVSRDTAWERAVELLDLVGIPDARRRAEAYPHEFSGGMAQRAMIAIALACDPELLIADEPTTALDVTIQAQILDLLNRLRKEIGMAVIMITHDLGVIAEVADRVAVMYAGRIVEHTKVQTLFDQPRHPYTEGLMGCMLSLVADFSHDLTVIPGAVPNLIDLPAGCKFAPRCVVCAQHDMTICHDVDPRLEAEDPDHEVRCWIYQSDESRGHTALFQNMAEPLESSEPEGQTLSLTSDAAPNGQPIVTVSNLVKHFPVVGGVMKRTQGWVKAVDGVSFSIERGQTLGLVGESGCGKTTVGRTILRLIAATSGATHFDSQDVFKSDSRALKKMRRNMQIIFQDPFSSLDPRMKVGQSIGIGLYIQGNRSATHRSEVVRKMLHKVGLEGYHADRYPHEFSGGQLQRVGIARALALEARFIVCDEPVSALDVSIQSQILNLLRDLQNELDLTYLFIAHDMSVVRHISHNVAVMYLGKIVEVAPRDELFANPNHPYTKALMSAIPVTNPREKRERILLAGDVPSPLNPPSGCHFHTRCPFVMERCRHEEPQLIQIGEDHQAACWLND